MTAIRGHTTGGNGTSTTPRPLASPGATAGFAAEVIATTPATAGTTHDLWSGGWNVRIPLEKWFPEEAWQWVTQAETTWVLRMLSTVADDILVSGTLYCLEQKS